MADKPKSRAPRRSPWAGGLVVCLALAVLAGTLAWSALDLRARVRAQIVRRDALILDAVAQMQHLNDQSAGEAIASLEDSGEQFELALRVSRLRDVIGVRLYSPAGKFLNAFPAYITEAPLPAADLTSLQRLQPVSWFAARGRLADEDMLAETNGAPAALLFVSVPLRTGEPPRLAGVIQFIMDGSSIGREYADLDRTLAWKFSLAFLIGAVILTAGIGLAWRREQRANEALARRTGDLLQANRELALAARTSAVGAVAAHLIHGLKNPLSGLRHFVDSHNMENEGGAHEEWQSARGTTQRMEELINRVVRVLQEQQAGVEYEISIAELLGLLTPKARAMAKARGVRFETKMRFDGNLSNREADLILLILENLVQNAIEATPAGKSVKLTVAEVSGAVRFEVRDQGPGLPPGMEACLFMPGPSAKPGGGGIGLAISKHLAQSLGARLELIAHTSSGCAFQLAVSQSPADIKCEVVDPSPS